MNSDPPNLYSQTNKSLDNSKSIIHDGINHPTSKFIKVGYKFIEMLDRTNKAKMQTGGCLQQLEDKESLI